MEVGRYPDFKQTTACIRHTNIYKQCDLNTRTDVEEAVYSIMQILQKQLWIDNRDYQLPGAKG